MNTDTNINKNTENGISQNEKEILLLVSRYTSSRVFDDVPSRIIGSRYCQKCHSRVLPNVIFCPQCGAKIEDDTSENVDDTQYVNPLASFKELHPQLRRIYFLIEDDEFEKANALLDSFLDVEPENPYAYLAKIMIDVKVNTVTDLYNTDIINFIVTTSLFRRLKQFSDDNLKHFVIDIENLYNAADNSKNKSNGASYCKRCGHRLYANHPYCMKCGFENKVENINKESVIEGGTKSIKNNTTDVHSIEKNKSYNVDDRNNGSTNNTSSEVNEHFHSNIKKKKSNLFYLLIGFICFALVVVLIIVGVNRSKDVTRIKLDSQGGSTGIFEVDVAIGYDMPSLHAPTKEGYKFKGYFEYPNGKGIMYYDSSMKSVRTWDNASGEGIIYAYWQYDIGVPFREDRSVGTKVHIDVLSIEPKYSIITKYENYNFSSTSYIVCECRYYSHTYYIYLTEESYRKDFDENAIFIDGLTDFETVIYQKPVRIVGIVANAESVCDGLSKETGLTIIEYKAVIDH